MLTAILSTIVTATVTFLLTVVAGNKLVLRWQHRGWINQQLIIDRRDQIDELKKLVDDISTMSSKRQSRMMRVARVLRESDKELLRSRLSEYDKVVTEWNDTINSMYSRLTIIISWRHTTQLESLQTNFVALGAILERTAKRRLSGEEIKTRDAAEIISGLNRLQGEIGFFQKRLLSYIMDKKKEIYGEQELSSDNLDRFPTWELIKALFK